MKSGKRPPFIRVNLELHQEEELCQWVRENPAIYNKGDRGYKDTDKRKNMWRMKAAEMEVSMGQLEKWYENMRTRYGKLSKMKMLGDTKEFTFREKWILTNFDFLSGHITRHPSRSLGSLRLKALKQEGEEYLHDEEFDPDDSIPTGPNLRKRRKRGVAASEGLIEDMFQPSDSSQQLPEVHQFFQQHDDPAEKAAWGQWMAAVARDIHPSLWKSFQDWSYQGLQYFKEEGLRLQGLQVQHHQVPQQLSGGSYNVQQPTPVPIYLHHGPSSSQPHGSNSFTGEPNLCVIYMYLIATKQGCDMSKPVHLAFQQGSVFG